MVVMGSNVVGPRVKTARMALRPPLTQYALAVRLQLNGWDISRSGIAKIEIKLRKVTDVEILLLAKVLGVTVAWLFDQTD
jgi:transcriptional regulator with XRE-family HTH domain